MRFVAGFEKKASYIHEIIMYDFFLCMLQDVEHKTLYGLSKYSTTTIHAQTFLVWIAIY